MALFVPGGRGIVPGEPLVVDHEETVLTAFLAVVVLSSLYSI